MRAFPVNFGHLVRMTDDTGLIEHGLGAIPRRSEGYTTDDNARALWLVLESLSHASAARLGDTETKRTLQHLADIYLSFLAWAQTDDGSFHNNFSYDRRPEPETPSDDCQGRALWALAVAYVLLPDTGRRAAVAQLLRRGLPVVERLRYARGIAYSAAACALLWATQRRSGRQDPFLQSMEPLLERWTLELEARLLTLYAEHRKQGWHWFEPTMTYGNGVLPWSLLYVGQVTGHAQAETVGLEALAFLIQLMTAPEGHLRPIGNQGWATPASVSKWDQQPLEIMKLALACAAAWHTTGDDAYRQHVLRCMRWYLGENDLGVAVADEANGACCDGLTAHGVNPNQGAESTLAYLLTSIFHAHVVAQTPSYTFGPQPELSAEELLMA